MDHRTAVELIRGGIDSQARQRWADLGAGTGVFTRALASLLPPESAVLAIDKNSRSLDAIRIPPGVQFEKAIGDFTDSKMVPANLDGILMANSIHYVADKAAFIEMVSSRLVDSGRLVIVEYDLDTPNPWVPFPIGALSLRRQAKVWGFTFSELGRTPSRLNSADIYSCCVKLLLEVICV